MKRNFISTFMLAISIVACSKNEVEQPQSEKLSILTETEINKKDFAIALSKAIAKSPRISQVLQNEALKQFDNNTDVLYHNVRDLEVYQNQSLEFLISKEWHRGVEHFKKHIDASPLLNIFASDLEVFDKSLALEEWNTLKEVGVAVEIESGAKVLYVAGDSVAQIAEGEIPAIPTFVVNDNKRVEITSSLRSTNGPVRYNYSFIHPAYKGTNRSKLRNQYVHEEPDQNDWISPNDLSPRHLETWDSTFVIGHYGDFEQLHTQRAYLYYGDKNRIIDPSFNECLYRFKIAPSAYHDITGAKSEEDDPKILKDKELYTYARRDASIDEIINKIWTEGSFTFSFETLTPLSNGSAANQKLVFSVSPKELFIMNPDRERRHPTLFRKTRYTYTLNPERLEGRWVYPHKIGTKTYARISGAWDLTEQGLSKIIRVVEMDKGTKRSYTETFASEFFITSKLKADKLWSVIGLSAEIASQYKTSKTLSTTISYNDLDDDLGSATLLFTDPFIVDAYYDHHDELDPRWSSFKLKNLTTGTITMTIIPLKNN